MEENCENCRYARPKIGGHVTERNCHRRAPAPLDSFNFYVAELLRDIAWTAHIQAYGKVDEGNRELNTEATEAFSYSVWPQVETDDWCGEWEPKENGR